MSGSRSGSGMTKRSWKLQEFVAHGANVNCLSLGHKSGRVLVTGGDDKKVNLWAVGKPNCIMSLSGHTTCVECVRFGHTEELVCAGSTSGALKIWDLEAARIVRTLTGHKSNIRCIDFHPYGDFLASGSLDTNIKLWDIRRKGCIFTYKGHNLSVNSIKFSPDGQWIASAGEDGVVKLWDLRAGKLLTELRRHSGPVTDVEFHPHEFLLASGSADRIVNFWDLENFSLVSATDGDSGPIRCIHFYNDGECLFGGSHDTLRVYGWEPARTFDTVAMGWGRVHDIATAQTQLIGAAYHASNVSLFVVDLKKIQPIGKPASVVGSSASTPFKYGQTIRKSFIKDKPPDGSESRSVAMETQEESESGNTDPEEDSQSVADIKEMKDYQAIFHPRQREYPTVPQVIQTPEPTRPDPTDKPSRVSHTHPQEQTGYTSSRRPASICCSPSRGEQQNIPLYSNDASERDDARAERGDSRGVERQFRSSSVYARIESSQSDGGYGSPVDTVPSHPVQRTPVDTVPSRPVQRTPPLVPKHDMVEKTREEFVPLVSDKPAGLDFEDFLPRKFQSGLHLGYKQQLPAMSESEVFSSIMKGHDSMVAVLTTRQRNLQIIHSLWAGKDAKTAVETAVSMNDQAVTVDLLSVLNLRPSVWNLDLCVALLSSIFDLLQSKYEMYMVVGCAALRLILKNFASVIKSNISTPIHSVGTDISKEERYSKCMSCYNQLVSIRAFVLKRQTLQGKLGHTFRELHLLLQNLEL